MTRYARDVRNTIKHGTKRVTTRTCRLDENLEEYISMEALKMALRAIRKIDAGIDVQMYSLHYDFLFFEIMYFGAPKEFVKGVALTERQRRAFVERVRGLIVHHYTDFGYNVEVNMGNGAMRISWAN